jgi:Arc/MetJ-type ribon-helix-helix transcriptional regulator
MGENRSVEIPESLYNRIAARLKGSDFNSVSDYVAHVLREKLVVEEEASKSAFSKDEEEKIKARLRDLGYL